MSDRDLEDREVNPFERYDLDPTEGVDAITERLRARIEDARSDSEKAEIRQAWEELTLHPARRVRAAFGAHPATPNKPHRKPPAPGLVRPKTQPLTVNDLVLRPDIRKTLELTEVDLKEPPLEYDSYLFGRDS